MATHPPAVLTALDFGRNGPAFDSVPPELSGHEIEVNVFVAHFEENPLTAIATLGHVARNARDDHTGKAGHEYSSG